jgi:heme A synthase
VSLLIVTILARRRGHPSRRLVVGAAVLLTLTIAQAGAGFVGLTALHVPLGALLLAVTAMQLTAARQAG